MSIPQNLPRHKKYIVFAYEQYYPQGGTSDIAASFDTISEVEEFLNGVQTGPIPRLYDEVEIIDRDTWAEVPWRKVSLHPVRYRVTPPPGLNALNV